MKNLKKLKLNAAQWIEEIKDETVKGYLKENIEKYLYPGHISETIYHGMNVFLESFDWAKTPQGYNFWHGICLHFENGSGIKTYEDFRHLDKSVTNIEEVAKDIAEDTELVDFVKEFSTTIDNIETNKTYISANKKYEIEYLPFIPDGHGGAHITPVRIHNTDNYLQVSKLRLDEDHASARAIMFHIFQCVAQIKTEGHEGDEDYLTNSDRIALEVMKKIGEPITADIVNQLYANRQDASKNPDGQANIRTMEGRKAAVLNYLAL